MPRGTLRPNAPPSMTIHLVPGRLTLASLRDVWAKPRKFTIDAAARPGVDASAATVARLVAEHRTVYGVNTGFG